MMASFTYEILREMQKLCPKTPITSVNYDDFPRLEEAEKLLKINREDDAISLLTNVIVEVAKAAAQKSESEKRDVKEMITKMEDVDIKDRQDAESGAHAESNVLYDGEADNNNNADYSAGDAKKSRETIKVLAIAHFQRAKAHVKKRNFSKAKYDVHESIKLAPNFMPAYALLSDVEKEKGQLGKAEVALVAGLKFDRGNEALKAKLDAFRSQHDVKLYLTKKLEFDEKYQLYNMIQQRTIYDFSPASHPPRIIEAIAEADLNCVERLWPIQYLLAPSLRDFTFGKDSHPLMHFPVLGAQWVETEKDVSSIMDDYKNVIDFLVEQGVRLDAKDKMGCTALIHASCLVPQPELVKHLLERGADIDVQTVFGETALHVATNCQNITECEILLTHGADPYIKDNKGNTAYTNATALKDVYAVFDKHLAPKIPRRKCQVCGKKGADLKRCIKCRVIFYCGSECQRANWDNQKVCRRYVKGHLRLRIFLKDHNYHFTVSNTLLSASLSNFSNSYVPDHQKRPVAQPTSRIYPAEELYKSYTEEYRKKGNFFIKVQGKLRFPDFDEDFTVIRDHDQWQLNRDSEMLAYNEDRSFLCHLDPKQLDGPKMLDVLAKRGGKGFKVYFWAFMEKGKEELVVITDPRLPAQSW